jgi:hypothetical protein
MNFGTKHQTCRYKNKTPNPDRDIKGEEKRNGDELNPRGIGGESLPSSGGR